MGYFQSFKEILRTKTIEHTSISVLGTLINGVLGMIFYIVLARNLGPLNFGIFTLSITVLVLIADITNLGFDTSIIRFVGRYIKEDKIKAYRFLKLAFELKFLFVIIVLVIGFLFMPYVASNILLKPELTFPLTLSIFGVFTSILFSFATNTLQALQKYNQWIVVNLSSNLIRLTLLAIFFIYFNFSVYTGILSYIIAPLLGFCIGLLFLPNFLKVNQELEVKNELFSFNKWLILITIISSIGSRVDIFITGRLLNVYQLGLYGGANQLIAFFPQINYAIAAAVAPKIAGFSDRKTAFRYFLKLQLLILLIFMLSLLVLPLAVFMFPIILGQTYHASITAFIILYFSQLIFIASLPAHQYVYYFFSYPKLFVITSFLHVILVSSLSFILTPSLGINGSATAVLIGSLFNLVVPLFWVLKSFKQNL